MGKQAQAERTCMMIEIRISNRCTGIHARVLRGYYLHNLRLEKLALDEHLSYPHIKRIRRDALEMYGSKIGEEDQPITVLYKQEAE